MDYFTKISELNAKKAGLIEKANALIDKGELGGELEEVKNEIKSPQGEIEKVSEIAALSEKTAKKTENKQGSRPFSTLGEQLTAIRNAAKGQVDERLYAVNNDAKGANRQKGADGGYALQEDFAASILESAASSGEILSRVTSYTVGEGSSSVRWLRVDEDDISSSVCGGVRMYWAAEGYGVGASKPKFAETKLDLEKMMGYAYATDELLSDSVFMSSFFGRSFTLAAKRLLEDSIISGDGVGKPLGILSSPALVTVSKESEQSSGTITTENILKMWQRSLYDSRKRTVWLAHPDTEEQLQKLKFTDGALEKMTKKEALDFTRELEKLNKAMGGIKEMNGLPDALVVVDVGYHKIAIQEANKLGIPVVGIVDTNHNPAGVDYVIPGNDDSARAVALYAKGFADAILEGKNKNLEDTVKAAKDSDFVEEAAVEEKAE